MKLLSFISILGLLPMLVLAGEEPLEPLGDYQIDLETIEGFHEVASADGQVSIKVVTSFVGGNSVPFQHVCSVTDRYHDSSMGDSVHSTNFDLGRSIGIKPPLRLEKVKDRLYRFSYTAATSNSLDVVVRDITYDLHFEKNGKLTRMVETVAYSSFWDMDGSKMGLVVSGPRRSIYYVEPKPGSTATPGTLFFQGTVEGESYRGKILNWGAGGEDDSAVAADGEIQDGGKTVVLKSQPTELKDGKEVPVGPEQTHVLRLKSAAAE